MNKFIAKVRVKQDENLEKLIRAFFQDFNPKSKIEIKGKEANLEVVFNNYPKEIVKVICCNCEIIQFNCGEDLKENEEEKLIQIEAENDFEQEKVESENLEQNEQEKVESEILEQIEQEKVESEILEQIEPEKVESENLEQTEQENVESKNPKPIEQEKAKNENVEPVVEQPKKKRGRPAKKKEKTTTKVEQKKVVIPELKEIAKNATSSEEKAEDLDENIKPKSRVKMECMPEIKDFEEMLASIDKTKPVEDRVCYVLNIMGLSNQPAKERNQIVELASAALKKGKTDMNNIFIETKIPIEERKLVQMIFSKLINDFIQKYESGKIVKLLTFLSELQNIIMLESEIENNS